MKQLNIPFKIGMEYENWEFDLDILPDRLKGYDSYKYIGNEFNKFLNYSTDETELIFSLDILEAIIITFKNKDLQFYENLNTSITNLIPKTTYEIESNCITQKYVILDIELWFSYNSKTSYIILGKKGLIKTLINTLT